MKKFLLLIIAATMFAAFSVKSNVSSMTITITNVEKTADGKKVSFEIISDKPSPYIPGLLLSTGKYKGHDDWGGTLWPIEMNTVGNVTTGYYLDDITKSKVSYKIIDWDADGNIVESPVYVY